MSGRTAQLAGFGGLPPGSRLRLLKWSPHVNAARTMLGFCSVQLPSGLIVRDLRLMVGPKGARFLAMPSVKTERNGQASWSDILDFADRRTRDRFQDPILDLLRQLHPEAFEGEP
jgi:DNA-binding cell septation regulator SpoVG